MCVVIWFMRHPGDEFVTGLDGVCLSYASEHHV
jgi:hypothetical protein